MTAGHLAPSGAAPQRAAPPALLEPGQRGPNFALRSAEGHVERFYDRFIGNMMLLLFYSSRQSAEAAAALRGLAAQTEALKAAGTAAVAVSRDDLGSIRAAKAEFALPYPLYWDQDGAVAASYGLGMAAPIGGTNACVAYLLDRNQRVLASFTGGSNQAERAMSFLADQAPAPAVRTISRQAPVLLVPRVFGPDLGERAIAAWRNSHEEGQVAMPSRAYAEDAANKPANTHYLSLKSRLDHVADDSFNPLLMQTIKSRLAPELLQAFQFRIGAMERVCIGAYDAERGDYFRPHRDNITERTRERRFAVTINLNDDYDGGGVKFAEFSEDVYRPEAGGAVIFSCSLLHEALPVTRGIRIGAFTFLYGQGYKAENPAPR